MDNVTEQGQKRGAEDDDELPQVKKPKIEMNLKPLIVPKPKRQMNLKPLQIPKKHIQDEQFNLFRNQVFKKQALPESLRLSIMSNTSRVLMRKICQEYSIDEISVEDELLEQVSHYFANIHLSVQLVTSVYPAMLDVMMGYLGVGDTDALIHKSSYNLSLKKTVLFHSLASKVGSGPSTTLLLAECSTPLLLAVFQKFKTKIQEQPAK